MFILSHNFSGADMSIKDRKNRNFLHLAILNGAKLQDFGDDLFKVRCTEVCSIISVKRITVEYFNIAA